MAMKRVALAWAVIAGVAAAGGMGGCGLFGIGGTKSQENLVTRADATPYNGLANKSVAIVVYAPMATVDEYAGAREEISTFVATQMRGNMPTTLLVDPRNVVLWQDSTLNWANLPPADIGRHFHVDRVLVIQVLDYTMKRPLGVSNLQGRLRAQCQIFEVAAVTTAPTGGAGGESTAPALPAAAWSGLMDAAWPSGKPLDPTQTNENAVRLRTLETFSDLLVRYFYEHREPDTSIRG
jgi:hypothetical protein